MSALQAYHKAKIPSSSLMMFLLQLTWLQSILLHLKCLSNDLLLAFQFVTCSGRRSIKVNIVSSLLIWMSRCNTTLPSKMYNYTAPRVISTLLCMHGVAHNHSIILLDNVKCCKKQHRQPCKIQTNDCEWLPENAGLYLVLSITVTMKVYLYLPFPLPKQMGF